MGTKKNIFTGRKSIFAIPSFSAIVVDLKKMLEELEKMMKEALMKELGLTGNPDNYDLNRLQAQASSQNSSAQDTSSSTDSNSAQTNLTQTDSSLNTFGSSGALTSLASSIKSDITANLSVDKRV